MKYLRPSISSNGQEDLFGKYAHVKFVVLPSEVSFTGYHLTVFTSQPNSIIFEEFLRSFL